MILAHITHADVTVGDETAPTTPRREASRDPRLLPVYVVKHRSASARRAAGEARRRCVEWSCRWEVTGHTRMYVRDGDGACPELLREELAARGYTVRDAAAGWRAEKTIWIETYVKGPEGKPFNFQVRRVGMPAERIS